MKKDLAPKPSDSVLDDASRWVSKLDRGLTPPEQKDLDFFLRDPMARKALLELASLSDELNKLSELSPSAAGAPRERFSYRGRALSAASVLLVVVLGFVYNLGHLSPADQLPAATTSVVYETR
ncbi:MAG: hypothetical protein RIC89_11810, partial [Pseudomonadales bacterium]